MCHFVDKPVFSLRLHNLRLDWTFLYQRPEFRSSDENYFVFGIHMPTPHADTRSPVS